jgi:hypothetical protein
VGKGVPDILKPTILILAILSASAFSADVLETTTTFNSNYGGTVEEYTQGIPREHISASDVDSGRVFAVIGNQGNLFACLRMYSGHLSSLADSGLAVAAHLNNHAHHTARGDTVIIVTPRGNGKMVIRYHVNAGSLTFLDSVAVDSSGVADTQGGPAFDGGGNNMIIIGRNPDDMDTWHWTSTDKGVNWSSGGAFVDFNADTRYDLDEWGDSVSVMIYDAVTPFRYHWYLWYDGAITDSSYATASGTDLTRLYTHEVGRGGVVHLAFCRFGNPGYMVHSWREPSTGTWTEDTVYTSSGEITEGGNELWPAFSYSEYDATMRLAYTEGSTGPVDVYVKKWNYDTDSFGSGLLVSDASATDIHNLCGSSPVPSLHNSRGYFGFNELVGGTWSYQFVVIADSVAVEFAPPALGLSGSISISGGVTIQ